jgi:hypothetical protein
MRKSLLALAKAVRVIGYHGTARSYARPLLGRGQVDPTAHWHSASSRIASTWALEHASRENGGSLLYTRDDDLTHYTGANVRRASITFQRPKVMAPATYRAHVLRLDPRGSRGYRRGRTWLRQILRQQGYDGIILRPQRGGRVRHAEQRAAQYAPFHSKQVKPFWGKL